MRCPILRRVREPGVGVHGKADLVEIGRVVPFGWGTIDCPSLAFEIPLSVCVTVYSTRFICDCIWCRLSSPSLSRPSVYPRRIRPILVETPFLDAFL